MVSEGFGVGALFRAIPRAVGQELTTIVLWFWAASAALSLAIHILLINGEASSVLAQITAGIFSIAIFVAATLANYAAIYAGYARLIGAPVAPLEAMRAAFARVWACIGLSLLVTLIATIGFVLLLVPGIYACVVLVLALPALVIRNAGVFDSLGISVAMTRGYRLRILGILTLFIFIGLLAFFLALLAFGALLFLTSIAGLPLGELVSRLVEVVLNGVFLAAGGVMTATMFALIEADRAVKR